MKLGILGGTFDPIHRGHLLLAESARTQYQLDRVIFIPALIPPHKAAKRDMTPAPYRFKMAELALQNHPYFEVSGVEFDRPDISYTVETLRALKKKFPEDEFFLITGADSAADFSAWKELGEIQKMAVLLSARRPGVTVNPPEGVRIHWLDMPECAVSSSQIRAQWAKGEVEKGVLPAEVETYIRKMKLYE